MCNYCDNLFLASSTMVTSGFSDAVQLEDWGRIRITRFDVGISPKRASKCIGRQASARTTHKTGTRTHTHTQTREHRSLTTRQRHPSATQCRPIRPMPLPVRLVPQPQVPRCLRRQSSRHATSRNRETLVPVKISGRIQRQR